MATQPPLIYPSQDGLVYKIVLFVTFAHFSINVSLRDLSLFCLAG